MEVWSRCRHTARVRRCPPRCLPGWPPASPTLPRRARPDAAAPGRCRWRSAWTRSARWCWTGCRTGEAVVVDGLATRVQRPRGWANQKVLYDAKRHAHTAQGLSVATIWGDLLWVDGGVRHEALHDRVGVRDLHRLAVVAAG